MNNLCMKPFFLHQNILKETLGDEAFNHHYSLAAINSINWARIMAQVTFATNQYFISESVKDKF